MPKSESEDPLDIVFVINIRYGDMEAAHVGEMIFSIVVMLIGAIVLPGIITSGLTNFELKLDGARYDLFFRVKAIIEYLVSKKR